AVISLFLFAVTGWVISIIPAEKENRREVLRRELSEISQQRKVRIAMARVEIGQRCDVERARELTRLLVMDGRTDDARGFGLDFLARCGDDEVVDNWAHAPRPPRD